MEMASTARMMRHMPENQLIEVVGVVTIAMIEVKMTKTATIECRVTTSALDLRPL